MGGRPVLFLSYSGVLGGAERVLLDCATRLERPAVVACPEGPLAAAARAAGLRVEPLRDRSLRLRGARGAAVRGLGGLALDAARLARRHRPAVLAAWSARAVLAAAAAPRAGAPLLAVHHDLLPGGSVAAAVRAATLRADGVVATSEAVARDLRRGGVTILHPGVDLAAWPPLPAPEGPPRALVLGALVGWKRADLALEIAARLPGARARARRRAAPRRRRRLRGRAARARRPARPRRPRHVLRRARRPAGGAGPRARAAALRGRRAVRDGAAGGAGERAAGGRARRRRAAGDRRRTAPAASTRPATPRRARARSASCSPTPAAPAAARARAERFPVEASAARFAAAVEALAR